jgi:hypothetical protein
METFSLTLILPHGLADKEGAHVFHIKRGLFGAAHGLDALR